MDAVDLGLRVDDIWFRYSRNTAWVLSGASYVFEPGTVSAITGPSGRGKSTLLYILGLLVRAERGQIFIGPQRLDSARDVVRSAFRARDIGFVFQDAVLDPTRTVLENVMESQIYGARSPALLERATLLLQHFDVGSTSSRRPLQLSGGQQHRVALARALLHDPSIILADEPTGNLDRHNGDVVLRALRDHADRGGIVVVATHDPLVASMADRQVRL